MLTDWIHWLSSMPAEKLWLSLTPLLLLELPRYVLGSVVFTLFDFVKISVRQLRRWIIRKNVPEQESFIPTVCAVVVGHNEASTIRATLETTWKSYPHLEIIVVDDGSTDAMADVARQFAARHSGVSVLRRPHRGGKSSALNFALSCTHAEVVVCIDADCQLAPEAIWRMVDPFRDPQVGAVAGGVMVRDPFAKTVTWLQAFEYLRCIFVGRRITSGLGVLGIVSGAIGAYRREALQRVMGWDVGPGEDCDMTLRIRKCGLGVKFVPEAQCYTQVPGSWWQLTRQRRRWDWATVTFCCRKHSDMANPFASHFRAANCLWLADRWIFNVLATYVVWAYAIWLCLYMGMTSLYFAVLYYVVYVLLDIVQLIVILYFSKDRKRDLLIGLIIPLTPLYHMGLRAISLWAITEEVLFRKSYQTDFVPSHVRAATRHW